MTDIEGFLAIYGHSDNLLNNNDRYLTEKEYKHSIIRDKEFKSSKQVLVGRARLLRQQGKGKRPNKSRSLTTTEENEL